MASQRRSNIPHELLKKELDRIGADAALRSGFASADSRVTMEIVLAALRATPTGGGTAAFERALNAMLPPVRRRRGRSALLVAAYCTLVGAVLLWITRAGFVWTMAAVGGAVFFACAEIVARMRSAAGRE